MNKPIVVCGVDFSGTSMVAGMLHAAGIDMGDVESAEEVALLDRPVKYRTFEDRELKDTLAPLARQQMANLPDITHAWIENLYVEFMSYLEARNHNSGGQRWGVKNNGLVFLAMHEKFEEIPVQWAVTSRDLKKSIVSCVDKLGADPRFSALIGMEFLALIHLYRRMHPIPHVWPWTIDYDKCIQSRIAAANKLLELIGGFKNAPEDFDLAGNIVNAIDPRTKGVIPWHGSLQPQPSAAHS